MSRNNAVFKLLSVALVAGVGTSAALADDEVSFSVGLKYWNAQWQANTFPLESGTGKQIVAHFDSESKLVPIPLLSVRYKDFGLSASQFMSSSFVLSNGYLVPVENNRTETDINLLYSLIPGLSASVGMKRITWNEVVINGPTLALSASAPIGSGFGMYGTGGIGWFDTKTTFTPTLSTDYALGEVGLTYTFDTKSETLKGLTATLGYRYQKIAARSIPLTNNSSRDVNDITSGMTFSLIGRF